MTIHRIFGEHVEVMQAASAALPATLEHATRTLQACLARGDKILACGNGGSAATAQHFIAELVCRFRVDRRALPGVALAADAVTLTAIGNDYGFGRVFARQVEALARDGDVLVAISTSGNSANIVEAAKTARAAGCAVIALTGARGGELATHADIIVRAPSIVVARIQEVHDVCIHALAEALEDHASKPVNP